MPDHSPVFATELDLHQLIDGLARAKLETTVDEICDAIWLLGFLPRAVKGFEQPAPEPPRPPEPEMSAQKSVSPPSGDVAVPPDIREPEPSRPQTEAGQIPLFPWSENTGDAMPLRVPGLDPLLHPLGLGQAFRRLRRSVPSRTRRVLDEEATADSGAEHGGQLTPLFRSESTRWLEIAVILDTGPSMLPWRGLGRQYTNLLAGTGIFRDVRLWHLDTSSEPVLRSPRRGIADREASLAELKDSSGRRAIIIMTDTVSPGWHMESYIKDFLEPLASTQPVVIAQVLALELWDRTLLGRSPILKVSARQPGLPNGSLEVMSRLGVRDPRRSPDPAGEDSIKDNRVAFPVIGVESIPGIAAWTRVAVGRGGTVSARFLRPRMRKPASDDETKVSHSSPAVEIEQVSKIDLSAKAAALIAIFESQASVEARKILSAFAAAPLYLPVMRLVQRIAAPQSNTQHLAEVFLSGLLVRRTAKDKVHDEDDILFDFADGVRDVLLKHADGALMAWTQLEINRFIQAKFGQTIDFAAMINNPDTIKDSAYLLDPQLKPFASVTSSILRRMGGRYAELATSFTRSQRVLVIGSAEDGSPHIDTARALGQELARQGYDLITGGLSLVDVACAEAYLAELKIAGTLLADSLLMHNFGGEPKESLRSHRVVEIDKIQDFFTHAGATIIIGGESKSRAVGYEAITNASPLIPLACTGSAAEETYQAIYRKLEESRHVPSGLSKRGMVPLCNIYTAVAGAMALLKCLLVPQDPKKISGYGRKAWILVAGGSNDLPADTVNMAKELGVALAEAGYKLITGGWKGIDYLVADTFYDRLREAKAPADQCLRQAKPYGGQPDFGSGKLGQVLEIATTRDEYQWFVDNAAMVLILGGQGGTYRVAEQFAAAGKPVLAFPRTGGDAKLWVDQAEKRKKSGRDNYEEIGSAETVPEALELLEFRLDPSYRDLASRLNYLNSRLATEEERFTRSSARFDWKPIIEILVNLARIYDPNAQHFARRIYRRGFNLLENCFQPNDPAAASLLNQILVAQLENGQLGDAEELISFGLKRFASGREPHFKQMYEMLDGLAFLSLERGEVSTVESLESAIVDTFAFQFLDAGKTFDAEPLFRRVLALDKTYMRESDPTIAADHYNLAAAQRELGYMADAEENYRNALAIYLITPGPSNINVITAENNLGETLQARRKFAEAKVLYERALKTVSTFTEVELQPLKDLVASNLQNLLADMGGLPSQSETSFVPNSSIWSVVLKERPQIRSETYLGQLLLYRTSTQRTWLVATNKSLVVLLDDEDTRGRGELVQTVVQASKVIPIKAESRKGDHFVRFSGASTWWYYSHELFPRVGELKERIEGLLTPSIYPRMREQYVRKFKSIVDSQANPLAKILSVGMLCERMLRQTATELDLVTTGRTTPRDIVAALVRERFISTEERDVFYRIIDMRNSAPHSGRVPSEQQVSELMSLLWNVVRTLA